MKSFYKFYCESVVDFANKDTYCKEVWDDGEEVKLKQSVKDKILETLKKYDEFPLYDIIEEIRIVGSITSPRYTEDTDIDVHLTVDASKLPKGKSGEEWQKEVINWFNNNRDEIDGYIGNHPIEVFIQLNYFQDLASDGVYNVIDDEWIIKPDEIDPEYNPYTRFKSELANVRKACREFDVLLGDLKNDIFDYDVIKKAITTTTKENRKKLISFLKDKLSDIEKDIQELVDKKKKFKEIRISDTSPKNAEEAKKMKSDEGRLKREAVFKFVARLGYFQIIKDLEEVIDDTDINDKDVEDVKETLKRSNR